jgi:hypothetical protein
MDRLKSAICLPLSALWVLAVGHCLSDPAGAQANRCSRTWIWSADHGGRGPLKDARSFERSAQLLNRRLGTQTGWGGVPISIALSVGGFGELEQASTRLVRPTELLALANSWQFYWRTALEPRAPSSVS